MNKADIVKHLTDIADSCLRKDGSDNPLGKQLREAAGEITRLRNELAEVRDKALEEAAAYHDDLASQHEAAANVINVKEQLHHSRQMIAHVRFAAAIRKMKGERPTKGESGL